MSRLSIVTFGLAWIWVRFVYSSIQHPDLYLSVSDGKVSICLKYIVIVLYLSGRNESGANKNNESEKAFVKTKEYVWRQNNFFMKWLGDIYLDQNFGIDYYLIDS